VILDKSEEHIKENHKYLHGLHSLLPDIPLFYLVLISVEECDMLLQGQKSILQSEAHRFQKQVFAILRHSLVFMFICCTAAIITTGNNKLKDL